ncbi:MAG TPA: AraC family transcriptional regulator [Streptosporangiaceae bacterium]|nr:AraC family transcriptional regulator [Streptosporangiaceae bacterium]
MGYQRSIERVIEAMRANLGEPITVDDMARIAMFSKFHFSRVFRDSTGVSPGRFLSALRIQEAKHLLTTTSLSIADISNMVGYSSVGTFSSRFKAAVGASPSVFRSTGGFSVRRGENKPFDTTARNGTKAFDKRAFGPPPVIQGQVLSAQILTENVYVGLFPDVIPQGDPATCAILEGPGPFQLTDVPPGTWYLLAYSLASGGEDLDEKAGHRPSIGSSEALKVRHGSVITVDVRLRPANAFDPPILIAPRNTQLMASTAG